jgi:hypothetical protein
MENIMKWNDDDDEEKENNVDNEKFCTVFERIGQEIEEEKTWKEKKGTLDENNWFAVEKTANIG